MLTEMEIKNAKPREKCYSLSDGDGLMLLIKESGAKSWVLRYRMDGKEKRAGLGSYPEVGLGGARELKNAFKRELAFGGNPQKRKRDERKEATRLKAIKAATFSKLAEEWYSQNKSEWSNSHSEHVRRNLDACLLPKLGDHPIREITTHEISSLLLDVEKEKPAIAQQCKQNVSHIFQFAVTRGDADFNIVLNLGGLLKPLRNRHHSAVTAPKDVADLMVRIEEYHGGPVVSAALWFSLYTFQRPGEIRGAMWDEIDFGAALWRIPEHRMKNRRPHIVPLSRQVLKLLGEIKTTCWADSSPFVFPSRTSKNASMSEMAVQSALRAMGYTNAQMTAHGFRTTASTNLNEQGWSSDVIELCLSHTDRNTVRAAYNRTDKLEERRKMMQAWADWLDGLRSKNKIGHNSIS